MSNVPIFAEDLGRILSSTIQGRKPRIDLVVYDGRTGSVNDGPWTQVESFEGGPDEQRVIIVSGFSFAGFLQDLTQEILELILKRRRGGRLPVKPERGFP